MNVFSVTDQRCGEPTNGSLVGPTSTCECKVHGSPSECPPRLTAQNTVTCIAIIYIYMV